ncbi:spermatogenesis-associated protein 45 [Nannospalax galili]|uniref:Spermatogenesis associated 45 n=1 Tax=Nannospalax galili TaxID=1026970 RepID=A0A8C6QC91_NANGA|nr:spermatogenesis-associated protein 45 [Nannospalax galili]XP_029415322.1 spermatogenesis-associated protein 45 [Nannospalax galili]XP_029415323.1 spermatogenesis-associated protein 45 [Nannospalax galili]XP_029415324.1 spermatogenesis-associated protein 45 [Nannospalax galili]
MASMNKGSEVVKKHKVSRKQLLEEMNEKRESYCLMERSNHISLLQVQKRHFNQAYESLVHTKVKERMPESGRTSWVKLSFHVYKEKRHFPPKSKM